jgi:outer membrane protein TolC
MGLPVVDAARLIPVQPPLNERQWLAPDAAVAQAVDSRPDIIQRRLSLRIRELEYWVAENGVLPRLDLQALYRANGVGQRLDDALDQAAGLDYTDWTLGVTFTMPLGNRAPRANLRAAEWQLSRERALLRESVRLVAFRLAELVREIDAAWSEYEHAQRRVSAGSIRLETARVRFAVPPPSSRTPDGHLLLFDFQAAMRAHVDAVIEASRTLARYNVLLARYLEASGNAAERTRHHPGR